MKLKFLSILFLSLIISACGQGNKESNQSISPSEKALLDSLDFDYAILRSIRTYTDSTVQVLQTSFNFFNDSLKKVETTVKNHKGFSFKASQENARKIVFELKDEFKEKGYLIYLSDVNFGYASDEVSVLKSKDQFDILRVEETDGINYDLENKDVIAKLQEWNKKYPFQIIGADLDWVEAVFIKRPDNMKAFSKELYKFCPDIVDQGTGSVEELEKEMKATGILYLWWD